MHLRLFDSPPGFPGQPCAGRGEGKVRGAGKTRRGAAHLKRWRGLDEYRRRGACIHPPQPVANPLDLRSQPV